MSTFNLDKALRYLWVLVLLPIWVACDTGKPPTYTDTVTGLMWQVTPAENKMNYAEALAYCEKRSLDGHDDWRLPNITEMRSIIKGCDSTEIGGDCDLADPGCLSYGCLSEWCTVDTNSTSCYVGYGSGEDGCYWAPDIWEGPCSWYWSSSSVANIDTLAWRVFFDHGAIDYYDKVNESYVRCVRQ